MNTKIIVTTLAISTAVVLVLASKKSAFAKNNTVAANKTSKEILSKTESKTPASGNFIQKAKKQEAKAFIPEPIETAEKTEKSSSPINMSDYLNLATEVKEYRQNRLIGLDTFLKWVKEPNTILLDARSEKMFTQKHLAGAVNLNFSDFTLDNLANVINNKNTRILIYCNNNFYDMANLITGPKYFATKSNLRMIYPEKQMKKPKMAKTETYNSSLHLALNIATFVNLYGYGYRNIYELKDVVNIYDQRLKFEGEAIGK